MLRELLVDVEVLSTSGDLSVEIDNLEFDSREAIRTAVTLARPGDIILLAGKGHETYQDIAGVKRHFDDKEEVSNLFALRTKK